MRFRYLIGSVFVAAVWVRAAADDYQPADGPLMTRWAKDVSPQNVHPEYPRPQMVRTAWTNLNGLWEYAITSRESSRPDSFDGMILVPFPVESALSGVRKPVGPENRLWYRRQIAVDKPTSGRLLLHFGAVDWETTVWINGQPVGDHRGGYDPFSFDITAALKDRGPQEVVVAVWDPTDAGAQPRGKQVQKPEGIWYTAVTGIWRTVWLEPTPSHFVADVRITPDVDRGTVTIQGAPGGHRESLIVKATILADGREVAVARRLASPLPFQTRRSENFRHEAKIPDARLWSPESPFLYEVRIDASSPVTGETDSVVCYFGMRKISVEKDEHGVNRLFLNNKPLFQYGPLDQGWWPDGLYAAPSDEALRYDIEATKRLGFNMIRKHVKVEPERWYYWCDKLGILVWQDMPSGDRYIGPQDDDIQRSAESTSRYMTELKAMIDDLHNHPSVVMWVPFNEGWGQFDTANIAPWIKNYDPTRLVNSASGWTDRGVGDVHDIHVYPGPASPPADSKRAAVLGEFGGLGLPLKGHTWQDEKNWGYRSYGSSEELTEAYLALVDNLRPLIGSPGLAAAVYTQTTDVEIEVNGLLTYDRAVMKMPLETIAAANQKVFLPPPMLSTLLDDSREAGQTWRFTTAAPPNDWMNPSFDDSAWSEGEGGFGRKDTPGAVVRTSWESSDIWLRRVIELPESALVQSARQASYAMIHHDEDVEVYINGELALQATGYTTAYGPKALSEAGRRALRPGRNVVAVHCRQTTGGQYIDMGLLQLLEPAPKQ